MTNTIPGSLVVSKDVIADVAGNAVMQCYGVMGMVTPSTKSNLSRLLPKKSLRRGVVVTTEDDGITVDLYVILEHGVNINVVSENLANQVKFALSDFVKDSLKDVIIHVQGIKVR